MEFLKKKSTLNNQWTMWSRDKKVKVLKLKKAPYRLMQAPRVWNDRIDNYL